MGRSAEAAGGPTAPVADAAYGRKEPFRAPRLYPQPQAPLEAAAPAAPVADATYKKLKEKKQARMLPYVAVGGGAPYGQEAVRPQEPVEVVYRRPAAPVAITYKNKKGWKQARMLALNVETPKGKKVVASYKP